MEGCGSPLGESDLLTSLSRIKDSAVSLIDAATDSVLNAPSTAPPSEPSSAPSALALLARLKAAVKALVVVYVTTETPLDERTPALPELLECLEEILQHGLKDERNGSLVTCWNFLSLLARVERECSEGSRLLREIDSTAVNWETDLEKARRWLRLALNQRCIGDLQTLLEHSEFTQTWYQPHALLRNYDAIAQFVNQVSSLDALAFNVALEEAPSSTNDTIEIVIRHKKVKPRGLKGKMKKGLSTGSLEKERPRPDETTSSESVSRKAEERYSSDDEADTVDEVSSPTLRIEIDDGVEFIAPVVGSPHRADAIALKSEETTAVVKESETAVQVTEEDESDQGEEDKTEEALTVQSQFHIDFAASQPIAHPNGARLADKVATKSTEDNISASFELSSKLDDLLSTLQSDLSRVDHEPRTSSFSGSILEAAAPEFEKERSDADFPVELEEEGQLQSEPNTPSLSVSASEDVQSALNDLDRMFLRLSQTSASSRSLSEGRESSDGRDFLPLSSDGDFNYFSSDDVFAPDDIALDDFLRGEYNPQATVALTHTFLDQEDLHDAEDVAEGFELFMVKKEDAWIPPKRQLFFTAAKKGNLDDQFSLCAGCGCKLAAGWIFNPRFCHYSGKYYCNKCHSNTRSLIPALILWNWNFRKYPVSNFYAEFLGDIHHERLFDVSAINVDLYKKSPKLKLLKVLLIQLRLMKEFIITCPDAAAHTSLEIQDLFDLIDTHRLSLADLVGLSALLRKARHWAAYWQTHILKCRHCAPKGAYCEFCRSDKVIYPFHLKTSVICPRCKSTSHRGCYVKSKCPKCLRIHKRKYREMQRSRGLDADSV